MPMTSTCGCCGGDHSMVGISIRCTSAFLIWIIRFFSNRVLLSPPSHSTPADSSVEWSYALDVHINAFFPLYLTLYLAQLFLLPIVLKDNWVCLWVGNTLYLVACVQVLLPRDSSWRFRLLASHNMCTASIWDWMVRNTLVIETNLIGHLLTWFSPQLCRSSYALSYFLHHYYRCLWAMSSRCLGSMWQDMFCMHILGHELCIFLPKLLYNISILSGDLERIIGYIGYRLC